MIEDDSVDEGVKFKAIEKNGNEILSRIDYVITQNNDSKNNSVYELEMLLDSSNKKKRQ